VVEPDEEVREGVTVEIVAEIEDVRGRDEDDGVGVSIV